ncbi:peptidoglycan-binding domain-containing protein [Streptomyces sp. CB01201]|uniref:peptidoglycan-binding domain-containing protein n=1 Tax=Streptomyces sp. CB01201 TaxID=2020324 RepID=UPI00131DAE30|nr:peptidoglycan-binding protein [Streptomyces sp. CB01201]
MIAQPVLRRPLSTVLLLTLTLLGTAAFLSPAAHAVDSVRWEQTNLAGLGYLPSTQIDGVDGPRTHIALKSFQYDSGLDEDGAYGERSDLALHRQVRAVQSRAGVAADGLYGSGTAAAVKTWQGAHGIGADGVAGPTTMSDMGVPRTVWLIAQSMFAAHGWTVSAQFTCLRNLWNGEWLYR